MHLSILKHLKINCAGNSSQNYFLKQIVVLYQIDFCKTLFANVKKEKAFRRPRTRN